MKHLTVQEIIKLAEDKYPLISEKSFCKGGNTAIDYFDYKGAVINCRNIYIQGLKDMTTLQEEGEGVEWQPKNGEEVWVKVFSNWSSGKYIGFDNDRQMHVVREPKEGGGYLFSSDKILPLFTNPNEKVSPLPISKVDWEKLIKPLNDFRNVAGFTRSSREIIEFIKDYFNKLKTI